MSPQGLLCFQLKIIHKPKQHVLGRPVLNPSALVSPTREAHEESLPSYSPSSWEPRFPTWSLNSAEGA